MREKYGVFKYKRGKKSYIKKTGKFTMLRAKLLLNKKIKQELFFQQHLTLEQKTANILRGLPAMMLLKFEKLNFFYKFFTADLRLRFRRIPEKLKLTQISIILEKNVKNF